MRFSCSLIDELLICELLVVQSNDLSAPHQATYIPRQLQFENPRFDSHHPPQPFVPTFLTFLILFFCFNLVL